MRGSGSSTSILARVYGGRACSAMSLRLSASEQTGKKRAFAINVLRGGSLVGHAFLRAVASECSARRRACIRINTMSAAKHPADSEVCFAAAALLLFATSPRLPSRPPSMRRSTILRRRSFSPLTPFPAPCRTSSTSSRYHGLICVHRRNSFHLMFLILVHPLSHFRSASRITAST